MSHYIDTQQTPYGASTGLSPRRRWEIVIGVVIAAALGVAVFVFVNRTESPIVDHAVQSVAQNYAGIDDSATRFAAPAQSFAGSDDLATRSTVPALSFVGSDDMATRMVISAAPNHAGADDLATRTVMIPVPETMRLAGSDDMATRLSGPRYAGSDDMATR